MKQPAVYIMGSKRNGTLIAGEKQIKGGSRAKKLALIEALNPDWRDPFEDIAAS